MKPVFAFLLFISFASNGQTGLSFIPDFTFKGSSVTDWKTIGENAWTARDGVITGKGSSGLLLLNKSFQDVGIHTLIKCSETAEAGFLFRLEKQADSMKAVMVAIKNGEITSYKISFDANGKERSREELRRAGSIVRLAPPPNPNAPAQGGNNANRNRRPQNNELNLPLVRPNTAFKSNDWNQLEIFLDLNIIRSFLNDGGETAGGAADEAAGRYGPIGLYVSNGEANFKDLKYKDLALRFTPEERSSARFRVQRISDMYYSWSAAAADFNKDGQLDVAAGPYIYFGPGFTSYREIFPGFPYNPYKDFTETNCQYSFDFNNDGWPDILTGPPRATLYINPRGESRRWDKYEVIPAVQSEVTVLADIDKDGKPELVYCADGSVRYAKPDPSDPTKPWIATIISERGYATAHGIGTGDINGDGRIDIINPHGWWEQPATISSGGKWKYHPQAFARYGHRSTGMGGSVMAVYDVNGDKLNDVVTSLNAHGFGLAWFEQKRNAAGEIEFVRHMISDDYSTKNAGDVTTSQLHGSTFADVDGDGVMDFIVGKRYWSHLDSYFDPDPYGAPVLYWYRTVRNPKAPGGAEFIPELVHNRSGAGSDVLAVDLDKNGAVDIVTSTDRGTFIFWNIGSRKKITP